MSRRMKFLTAAVVALAAVLVVFGPAIARAADQS